MEVNKTDHGRVSRRRLVSAARRMAVDPATRAALFAFILTRGLILLVILLGSSIDFEPAVETPFGSVHESSISLRDETFPAC